MATILVVDDEVSIAQSLAFILEAEGHRAVTAENGAEAIRRAREMPPDLIVTDLMMPFMCGYELCRAVQRDDRLQHVPIIMMTAVPSALHGRDCDPTVVLAKPFAVDVLLAAVAQALAP